MSDILNPNQISMVTPTTSEEGKGESYDTREAELIKELVKTRLEKNSELEFETFEGYEIPPRTQFSMLNKPAVSVKYGKLSFNMACIRLFEGVKHILTPINSDKKRLLVVCCNEEESESVEWARQQAKDGKWVNKEISSVEVCEKLYNAMGWDRRCRYKVLGRVVNSPEGLILRFDLAEAIMFTGLPEEYVDPKTGELKKRHVSYYPDIYKGRIGRSYNDYIATQQLDLFEPLEGFTGKTYEDLPPEGSDETADTQTDATPVYQQHTLTGNGGQYE